MTYAETPGPPSAVIDANAEGAGLLCGVVALGHPNGFQAFAYLPSGARVGCLTKSLAEARDYVAAVSRLIGLELRT